jgi:hypothetical protein
VRSESLLASLFYFQINPLSTVTITRIDNHKGKIDVSVRDYMYLERGIIEAATSNNPTIDNDIK